MGSVVRVCVRCTKLKFASLSNSRSTLNATAAAYWRPGFLTVSAAVFKVDRGNSREELAVRKPTSAPRLLLG